MITQVHYREGQLVRTGQPLIDIDPRPFEAAVHQAQGQLERDTNLLAQAQMDLERYQAAWARNAIAKQTLDDQEKLVLQDQGTVKNDQGTCSTTRSSWASATSPRPSPARVGLRLVDPGNVATSNGTTPLAVITQMQPITVVFTVSEDNVPELQLQMRHGKPLPVDALDRSDADEDRGRDAAHHRQPDRHHHRHREAARAVRQRGQRALPQSVRQHPPAGRTPCRT